MASTTVTQVPYGVERYYDRRMLMKARPMLNYLRWAQTRDIPANNTDRIRFRRYSLLTAATTPLSEGVTPAGSQLSVTNVDAQVKQYGDFVTLTDFLSFTTLDPIMRETSDILGQQGGNTLDQLTREVLQATTTKQFASTATDTDEVTSGMKLTKAEVKEAVRTLKNNNAKKITGMVDHSDGFNSSPIDAAFIGLVHPDTVYDLKDEPGFIRVEEYGQKKAMDGEVGALDEVRFVESTNAKVESSAGSGSIDVYHTIILGAEAYAQSRVAGNAMRMITKPLGSAGSADPLDQRQTMGWKASFAAVILNNSFMVDVEHATSSS